MIKVLFFGRLQEITGKNELSVENAGSLGLLKENLIHIFSGLALQKFSLALNHTLCNDEATALADGDVVALLPPFSGG